MTKTNPGPRLAEATRPTVRLTTAQAIVRYLAAQHSVRDGQRQRLVPAMLGIFGHPVSPCQIAACTPSPLRRVAS